MEDQVDKRGLPIKVINEDIYVDEHGIIRSKVKDEKTVGDSMLNLVEIR